MKSTQWLKDITHYAARVKPTLLTSVAAARARGNEVILLQFERHESERSNYLSSVRSCKLVLTAAEARDLIDRISDRLDWLQARKEAP